MHDGMLWFLVLPVLVLAILYYLGFLTIGLSFVVSGFRSSNPGRRAILVLIGLGVVSAPFIFSKIQRLIAERNADTLQQEIAGLDRIDLAGRLPEKFVTVGRYHQSDIDFIGRRYGMSQFAKQENDRLKTAYRRYRKAEFCHKYLYKKKMAPNINISNCRDLPASIQAALNIQEPILFFVEGSATSYRRSNVIIGKMYEVRLVTPQEDLLVDYYEQRTVDDPASIINPYSSGRRLDWRDKPPTKQEFVEAALQGASR